MNPEDQIRFESWDTRVAGALVSLGVTTWGDLTSLSELQLLRIKGFGRWCLRYVKDRLSEVGLRLDPTRRIEWPIRQGAERPTFCGVYFVACGAFVKIGWSADIRDRVATIQQHNPQRVELIHYIKADDRAQALALEKDLHQRFAPQRFRMEWFHLTDAIQQYIADGHTPRP